MPLKMQLECVDPESDSLVQKCATESAVEIEVFESVLLHNIHHIIE